MVIEADVTDQGEAERAVATTVEERGRLDILVNNAGVMLLGPIVEAPVEEWQRMVSVNVNGLLRDAGLQRGRICVLFEVGFPLSLCHRL